MFCVCHCNHNVDTSKRQKEKRKETKHINTKKNQQITMKIRAKDVTTTIKKPIKWEKISKMRTVSLHL